MSRSDSGYHSNLSNRWTYCGDPNSTLPEEVEDYQYDDSAMAWQQQYGMGTMDVTYDEQLSNYMVEGTGSHMAGYYQQNTMPRTTCGEAGQDMDLDDETGLYLKEEQQWTNQLGAVPLDYSQGMYQTQDGGPSTLSSTQDDGPSTSYYALSASPMVSPSLPGGSSTTRHGLPSRNPVTVTPAPRASNNKNPRRANQPTTTTHTRAAATTTATSSASAPSSSSTTTKFPCLMPACGSQFNRAADLDRHQKFIHCKSTVPAMPCDYKKCARRTDPFRRADHFRDHLREQHREDLVKRGENTGGGGGAALETAWWRGRSPSAVYRGWWRCSKCFVRVVVGRDGWQCGSCGNYCEVERQAVRKLPRACDYVECETAVCGHEECAGPENGSGDDGAVVAAPREWCDPAAFREHLRVAHGEDVPLKEGKDGERELADEEWWNGRSQEAVYSPVWRCTRCLGAADSTQDGFVCPGCGYECEEVRRRWRPSV
jgi:hypothetical protein